MGQVIYQYLPLSTFNTSISNKTIRLSDISKSNDEYEKKAFRDKVKPALKKAFDVFQLQLSPDDETATGYTFYESIIRAFNDASERMALVLCFSKEGDLLSQWRGYANDAEGMSIGYNRDLLETCFRYDSRLSILEIKYDEENQIHELEDYFSAMLFLELESLPKGMNNTAFQNWLIDEFEEVFEDVSDYFVPAICSCKNPAFKEEKEVRIVFQPGSEFYSENELVDLKINRCARLQLKPLDYFVRNGYLVPYMDINYEKALPYGLFKEIIIGPKVKETPDELREYLFFKGFPGDVIEKIEIRNSTAS